MAICYCGRLPSGKIGVHGELIKTFVTLEGLMKLLLDACHSKDFNQEKRLWHPLFRDLTIGGSGGKKQPELWNPKQITSLYATRSIHSHACTVNNCLLGQIRQLLEITLVYHL